MARAQRINEADLEVWLLDLCRVTGWSTCHFRPAMLKDGRYVTPVSGDGKGFPDYVLAHPGRELVLCELKSEQGRLTLEQTVWKYLLESVKGVRYILVRPSNRDELEGLLNG